MTNNISLLCRGEGLIYFAIELDEACAKDGLKAYSVFKTDKKIPLRLIQRSLLDTNRYVLIVMELSVKQEIRIVAEDETHEEIILLSHTLLPTLSAFSSKANSLMFSKECEAIRRIDNYRPSRAFSFAPLRLIQNRDNSYLFTVNFETADADLKDFDFIVLTADGRLHPFDLAPYKEDPFNDEDCSGWALSVNLTNIYKSLFVLALSKSNGSLQAYGAFTRQYFRAVIEDLRRRYSNASNDRLYESWFLSHKACKNSLDSQLDYHFPIEPLFSIVVPLYQTPIDFFFEMVESVLAQTYKNWELILVNASPENVELRDCVRQYTDFDSRIISFEIEANLGISGNTNLGIQHTHGDYVCFFDHDDVLEPDVLFEYVKAINANPEVGLLYCDEDKLFPNGIVGDPFFKPDFNMALLLDNNYICHMLTVKKSLLIQVEASTSDVDGAQDHNLTLQIAETGVPIHHVSKILYHWRVSKTSTSGNANSKTYARDAGIRVIEKHLNRFNIKGTVTCPEPDRYRYKISFDDSVVPTFDIVITSFHKKVLDENDIMELLPGELASSCRIVFAYTDDSEGNKTTSKSIEYLPINATYTWSQFINAALDSVDSSHVLVLDSHYHLLSENWKADLFGWLEADDTAMVAPETCDASGVIQNTGLAYAYKSIMPMFYGLSNTTRGYFDRNACSQDVTMITPFCFAAKKTYLDAVDRFDPSILNPIDAMADLCIRLKSNNKRIVCNPHVEVRSIFVIGRMPIHIPSNSFIAKWEELIKGIDPNLNPNLSSIPERCIRFKLDSMPY